ncbi:MAG: tetratricopeptide repeat protein, partial [Azoarcus sp.]|nr:tetratricopeptide repeat protein [Azoarcus sp.]
MAQNNLGIALGTLGRRLNDETQLQEAVTAYREALKEYTHEHTPLAWAMTQNNLGAALNILGERRGDETQLQEAVTA